MAGISFLIVFPHLMEHVPRLWPGVERGVRSVFSIGYGFATRARE